MARVAVCLFFIVIFQNGILKSSADEVTTEGIPKKNEEAVAKPTEDEPARDSEAPPKVEAEDKSEVGETSEVSQKKDGKLNEGKDAKDNESKKDGIENIGNADRFLPNMLKGVPGGAFDPTKSLFDFPKSILGPVNSVGAKLNEAVAKGLDSAKGFAGGTYNFFSTAVNLPFKNQ